MGSKCAPTFANLLMESLEQEFLDSILEKVTPQPTLWIRFIDDIFVIWPDTRATFLDFFDALNSHHPNISYTHELTTSSIAFLDLTIYKGHRFAESGILDIAPYFKPTNKFQYLHHQFCHPPSTFKGLILGEAIRMLRASSDPITFAQSLETIKDALTTRHYPIKLINKTLKNITYNDRSRFL